MATLNNNALFCGAIAVYIMYSLRGIAQLARASVSKTEGRGFKSLYPCHEKTYSLRAICFFFVWAAWLEPKVQSKPPTHKPAVKHYRTVLFMS